MKKKLSGDGAPVGKYRSFLNLSVSLPDEPTPAQRQPRLLEISTAKECWSTLQTLLRPLNNEIEEIQRDGLDVDGSHLSVVFFFGADYKFILLSCGMKDATSNHACIYCESKKCNYFRQGGKIRKGFKVGDPGVAHNPLLPAIPVDRIVIDVLHLFLRTSDKLLMMICREVPEEKVAEFVGHVQQQITCRGKIVARDGKIEFQNCDSKDRVKILNYLVSSDVLVNIIGQKRGTLLRLVLVKYDKALEALRKSADDEEVRRECLGLMKMYISVFQSAMVTPYFHIMFFHCGDIVARVGCLNVFTQQHVEKLNHSVTSTFLTTTNFTNGVRQVLQNHGRRILYPLENVPL